MSTAGRQETELWRLTPVTAWIWRDRPSLGAMTPFGGIPGPLEKMKPGLPLIGETGHAVTPDKDKP